jgi:dTDP-4-amino-4,6-dideoxygalactose transaminase
MSEPHAIIGLAQMRRLNEFIERRAEIAAAYDAGLPRLAPRVQPVRPAAGSRCNYYKYIALTTGVDRAALKKVMREEFDVGLSGEVYDTPCHLQPVFAGVTGDAFPKAEDLCARHICLPVSAKMSADDANYVLEALGKAITRVEAEAAARRE